MSQLQRRQALRLLASLGAAGVAAPVLSACGGSSLGSDDDKAKGSVKIGLLVPSSGIYKSLGDDMANGFNLYKDLNGGKLGGYDVEISTADEGETADSGKAGYDKLTKQDKVLAVTGVVSSATMGAIRNLVEQDKIPLVGSNASPTGMENVKWIWRTSYVNDEPGEALGKYVAEQVKPSGKKVFALAADYQAGKDEITGFLRTFQPAGGQLVVPNGRYTPFETTNFQPYLTEIKNANPGAVFCFYAGGAALNFVKQYKEFGLDSIPLYAPGFLTEGAGLLKGQGDAALNIYTSMNYAPDLDNAANRKFAVEYQRKFNVLPTTYAMASYDAAAVFDKALRIVEGDVTSASLNAAIPKIGEIESPRGNWQFNSIGTPLQTWYLRQVRRDGNTVTNSVISQLVTL